MEKTKKRQIEYHAIVKRIKRQPKADPIAFTEIYELLKRIQALPKKERGYGMKTSKICFLEKIFVSKAPDYLYVCGVL